MKAPNLDDRSFQELVDDAKRMIMERCDEWTDHNVSDPGVALIEAFAWMTELMLYRLNRVPERSYVKFLEMIGVTLHPPTAATVDVDFRLSAALPTDVTIPQYTVVSTERTNSNEPVLFTLLEQQVVRSAKSQHIVSIQSGGRSTDLTHELGLGEEYDLFQSTPVDGDAIWIGFDVPLDRHLVLVTAKVASIAGHGIDPDDPPLVWEARTADGWRRCQVIDGDNTSGFNESGTIEVALPDDLAQFDQDGNNLYWLRCRATTDHEDPYRETPRVTDLSAASIGVVGACVNASVVENEILDTTSGTAGQALHLAHTPIVESPTSDLQVATVSSRNIKPEHLPLLWDPAASSPNDSDPELASLYEGHQEWAVVDHFADTGADDHHISLNRRTGELRFGPEIREADGGLRRFGATPNQGSQIIVNRYWHGGGLQGNILPRSIRSIRSSVPNVAVVRNRSHGRGGVDGETLEAAKLRGPLELRSRNRAVTSEDFEYLAQTASPLVNRAKCLADDAQPDKAVVRVVIVPASTPRTDGPIPLDHLDPGEDLLRSVSARLDKARMVGTTVRVEPPEYVGVAVEAILIASPDEPLDRVRSRVLSRLYEYFNPLSGGNDGDGWAFGRGVRTSEAVSVLQSCHGVDVVEDLKLKAVDLRNDDPESQTREDQTDEGIEVYPNELVVSGLHRIEVYHVEDE